MADQLHRRNEGNNAQDRRKHARFELLDYAMIFPEGGDEPIRSVVIDLSLGGLQVRTRHAFPVGQPCVIIVGRGESRPLTVHAECRYTRALPGSALFASGFRFRPNDDTELYDVVNYAHDVFQAQGERLLN